MARLVWSGTRKGDAPLLFFLRAIEGNNSTKESKNWLKISERNRAHLCPGAFAFRVSMSTCAAIFGQYNGEADVFKKSLCSNKGQ